ncbi:MAG TPA: hypothetical protein VJ735_05970 [Actinomycetes bacterium]|nr:hypothetical protein [Actinomycetes bacterium]
MSDDRTTEILAAIGALSDRIGGLETKVDRVDQRVAGVDQRLGTLETKVDRVDSRLERVERCISAIARNTLSPAECVALGIQDARHTGSVADIAPPIPVAAKGSK